MLFLDVEFGKFDTLRRSDFSNIFLLMLTFHYLAVFSAAKRTLPFYYWPCNKITLCERSSKF